MKKSTAISLGIGKVVSAAVEVIRFAQIQEEADQPKGFELTLVVGETWSRTTLCTQPKNSRDNGERVHCEAWKFEAIPAI